MATRLPGTSKKAFTAPVAAVFKSLIRLPSLIEPDLSRTKTISYCSLGGGVSMMKFFPPASKLTVNSPFPEYWTSLPAQISPCFKSSMRPVPGIPTS